MATLALDDAIKILVDVNASLDERFRALYVVKNEGGRTPKSAKAVMDGVNTTDSVLLQHELLYNIGQFQLIENEDGSVNFIDFLCSVVTAKEADGITPKYHCVSRHEALESIGAIFASGYYYGTEKGCNVIAEIVEFLKMYSNPEFEPLVEVSESAYLSLRRIEDAPRPTPNHPISAPNPKFTGDSQVHDYLSIDPSPPFHKELDDVILKSYLAKENAEAVAHRILLLSDILNNRPLSQPPASLPIDVTDDLPATLPSISSLTTDGDKENISKNKQQYDLWDRYRAMFSLRNISTKEAALELCKTLASDMTSALFRHEVAFVLGQMEMPATMQILGNTVLKEDEHPMVRHEAAEAVGAIADDEGMKILEEGAKCPEAVVADSCVVAIEMLKYWSQFAKHEKKE